MLSEQSCCKLVAFSDETEPTASLGLFQPLPYEQPASDPWSWQVSHEQMLRKIGSFTKCLQILPAGPLPILPSSPLWENMHVCPQPLSSGSFLMGLALKAWRGGGALQELVSSASPHPQGEMLPAQPAWLGEWRWPLALLTQPQFEDILNWRYGKWLVLKMQPSSNWGYSSCADTLYSCTQKIQVPSAYTCITCIKKQCSACLLLGWAPLLDDSWEAVREAGLHLGFCFHPKHVLELVTDLPLSHNVWYEGVGLVRGLGWCCKRTRG